MGEKLNAKLLLKIGREIFPSAERTNKRHCEKVKTVGANPTSPANNENFLPPCGTYKHLW